MTYDELTTKIKGGKLDGIFFFYGEERYLLEKSIALIKKKVITPGTEVFNFFKFEGKKVAIDEISAAVDRFPQMSLMKLIIVKNSGMLNNAVLKEFKIIKNMAVPPDTCLIFVEDSFDKKKLKNLSFIESSGGVVSFNYMPFNKLEIWIEKRFKSEEKEILERDTRYILQLCGQSLEKLTRECEKLSLYTAEKRRITRRDIDAVIEKTVEFTTYNMVDNVVAGQVGKAFEQLKYLRDTDEKPFYILNLVMSRLSELLLCKLLKEDGLSTAEIGSYFDFPRPAFVVNKTIEESRSFSEKYLKSMINRGLYYDLECKQGRLSPWPALELYLAELTDRKRR